MDDLISRQAALDALNGGFTVTGRKNAETIRDYLNGVDKKIRELPSAERHGRWIIDEWDTPNCSACGCPGIDDYYATPYCPHCGTKMDEVTE